MASDIWMPAVLMKSFMRVRVTTMATMMAISLRRWTCSIRHGLQMAASMMQWILGTNAVVMMVLLLLLLLLLLLPLVIERSAGL